MEYCELKSGVAAVRVTFTVPLPVRVPVPLTTTDADGVKVTLAATVNVPEMLKSSVDEKPLVLFTLTLLKPSVAEVLPVIDVAAGVPGVLKLSVLVVMNKNGVAAVVFTIQLPRNVCVRDVPAAKVADPEIVKSPLTVSAPPAVFALVLERVRTSYVVALIVCVPANP